MVMPATATMRTSEVIAEFLRLRKEKGQLVPSVFARKIGVTPAAVAPMLAGDRDFPMIRLDETAAFFGWDAVELIQRAREEVAAAQTRTEEDRRIRLLELRLPIELQNNNNHENGDE